MNKLSNSPNLSSLERRLSNTVDQFNLWLLNHQLLTAALLLTGSLLFFLFIGAQPAQTPPAPRPTPKLNNLDTDMAETAPEVPQLDPPKDTPFTTAELNKYDGSTEGLPIYVAIKGIIFDVSAKKEMYGPGAGYHIFAGKDGSRGLGKSSLKPEDAVSDYSTLDESERVVLEDWVKYFTKRYNIVGKVVD